LAQLEELPCFGQAFTKTCLRRFQLVFLGFDNVCAPIWDIFRNLRTRNTGEGIQHHNRDVLRPANPILCYLSPCSLCIVLARQLCVSFQIIFFLLLHALPSSCNSSMRTAHFLPSFELALRRDTCGTFVLYMSRFIRTIYWPNSTVSSRRVVIQLIAWQTSP
jgi:hypothetical protein